MTVDQPWQAYKEAVLATGTRTVSPQDRWRRERLLAAGIAETETAAVAEAYLLTLISRVPLIPACSRCRITSRSGPAEIVELQGQLNRARAELTAAQAELSSLACARLLRNTSQLVDFMLRESTRLSKRRDDETRQRRLSQARWTQTSRRSAAASRRARSFRDLVVSDASIGHLDHLIACAPNSTIRRHLQSSRNLLAEAIAAIH